MKYLSFIVIFLLLVPASLQKVLAAQVDVQIIATSSERKIQKALKKALAGSVKVKSYNASMLMMADYSGKQKAIAKIASAKVVVWLGDKAKGLMDNPDFSNSVSVSDASEASIDKIKAALNN